MKIKQMTVMLESLIALIVIANVIMNFRTIKSTLLAMPKIIRNYIFNERQWKIINDCRAANQDEYSQWLVKNVGNPFLVIMFPVVIAIFFKTNVTDLKSLVFNGTLSLLGVNILYGMSSYLIKYQKHDKKLKEREKSQTDEKKLNDDAYYLRDRLNSFKHWLVVTGAGFYIVIKLFNNTNSTFDYWAVVTITIIILILSIAVGRVMFIVKDDFFDKTYYNEMSQPVLDARPRWDEKYGSNPS